ncbi:IS21 family transposase [Paracoccus sp. MC1862]|uniref:IS21 family transposase n=1 Tax=Paracoccus sp. MC1862 TaxID=2760307 RepID=UPI00190A52B9|nr:IS21 family transposase [Paracoccus sp. MC1862]QQO43965.1 IS21 family transposase [Paracoccus sp. MC1862]QQO44212.1 IS21 family transposase [Paracoccus sp. MC1862]QQO44235.1 IS21 family transposase [Paracoccus sp. MC1862]QQO44688.1 IS21 family transposase [Paracoccus sp. MC1862]QQO44881.1 IS21 family transposase [Paracoccus sp. MC1862]
MGLLNIIRRMALREKLPIREIARRTGLSRNTIRKYLSAGTIEPRFATPDRPSKLDPFSEKLAAWLKTEAGKSRKQRRTLKQLHADLVALGFTGSYGRVAAFARQWRMDRQREQQTTGRGTFVPLVFRPGEAFQFDWSEDYAVLGGERTKLQVAHIKLAHSRAFLVRAYLLQTHEMLFDAHWHGFRVFGGVPGRGIYDNMKTAVDRVGRGKERQVNIRFLAMTNHYVFEPEFCNPAAGWEKGQVEKNVQDARPRLWQPMPNFPDLAALNAWLERRCLELWREIPHGVLPGTVADAWAEEQAALMPLPPAFDGFVERSKRVSPTCLISFERNRYSVPASFANRPVSLRVYPDRLVVAAEGQILCEHGRVIQRSHHLPPRTIYDWRHYLAVIQRKPGALRNGAPFAELPAAFRQLQDQMLRRPGGDREMVDILALVLQHDEQAVLVAVEMALAEGVATKTHVLNLLHRLIDGKTTGGPNIDTPEALILRHEPKANVERYDDLRAQIGDRHAS